MFNARKRNLAMIFKIQYTIPSFLQILSFLSVKISKGRNESWNKHFVGNLSFFGPTECFGKYVINNTYTLIFCRYENCQPPIFDGSDKLGHTLSVTPFSNKSKSVALKTHFYICRSSRPKVFCKKGVLRNFTKFTGKHLCQSLFFKCCRRRLQLY